MESEAKSLPSKKIQDKLDLTDKIQGPRLHGRKLPAICRNESALYPFTRRPRKLPGRNADTILERCVEGKTQNSKESLHSCIWRKCPKEVFVSKRRLEIAVTEAIEKHNVVYGKSLE
ncbi:hypothetical protein TNCV_3385411 [Trichonephila clavipes]|uniref:Uncharacterized protein n=1 Tax=Trichonephila clavipes TaxID=2585209 RepID=A0A8X6VRJ2_TRICX|nr:hypothetical protein TNCV_3385411 [Trichonephila clavipes]